MKDKALKVVLYICAIIALAVFTYCAFWLDVQYTKWKVGL